MEVARIEDEIVTAEELVKVLAFDEKLAELLEDVVSDILMMHVAKKQGMTIGIEELQQKSEQFRRARGLHRTKDTLEYIDKLGLSVDDFERYLEKSIYREKMLKKITGTGAVEAYFKLNSPLFDAVECSHILLSSEDKANEMFSVLQDDPGCFAAMAEKYSLCDSKKKGGQLGKVLRGTLPDEIEARIFNANEGDLIGPIASNDGIFFQVFLLSAKHPAQLDDMTTSEVEKLIYRDWLHARSQEHNVEML